MKEGKPIIYQGVLHNKKNKTYGCPDFLIRSDWADKIFEASNIISPDKVCIKASKLNGNYHYVVVDAKWSHYI